MDKILADVYIGEPLPGEEDYTPNVRPATNDNSATVVIIIVSAIVVVVATIAAIAIVKKISKKK